MPNTISKTPDHTIQYHKEEDVLVVIFAKPRETIYDDEMVYDKSLIVGREKSSSNIRALGILKFKPTSPEKIKEFERFFLRFGVKLPSPSDID